MPRAPVLARLLGWVVAMTIGAGIAAAQSSTAMKQVATTRQAPSEFGLKDYTVTTIGFGSFTPASNDNSSYPAYLDYGFGRENSSHHFDDVNDAHYYATVSVPAGAVIDFIGLQSRCVDGVGAVAVHLTLIDRYGSATPIGGFSCTHSELWVTDYNATAIGFQLAQNAHNLLVLDVEDMNGGNPSVPRGMFAWVEVWWKRAVSPPPATATFTDVPTSDLFFQYIEALAASGITAGCGNNKYCPDQPLTRGQMAVFLAKGFGLHWPN